MPHNLVGSLTLARPSGRWCAASPRNGAVWALGWSMVFQAVGQVLVLGTVAYGVSRQLGSEVVRDGPCRTRLDDLPTWFGGCTPLPTCTWIPAVVPLVTFALLLFPDGRLPSRRWRPVAVARCRGR
jgi:two-component system, NarL family, sensor kinase